MRDIIEHFPLAKGSKSDPQLVWTFGDDEVKVKSIETSLDAKGKAQLSTELTISAEEFEQYDICDVPTTLAFHLREFTATIAFAEAGSLSLSIEFTDTTSPLYIALDGDLSDNFFVIAASTLGDEAGNRPSRGARESAQIQYRGKKRPREEGSSTTESRHTSSSGSASRESGEKPPKLERTKPMKVSPPDCAPLQRDFDGVPPMPTPPSARASMPPPSIPLPKPLARPPTRSREPLFLPSSQASGREYGSSQRQMPRDDEPLFLPGTQLSQAEQDVIRGSGLGIESMTAGEFAAMLEGDADEIDFDLGLSPGIKPGSISKSSSLDIYDEMEMEPTQPDGGPKAFKPLFED